MPCKDRKVYIFNKRCPYCQAEMHGKVVKGLKKYENSSNKTAAKQTHPSICPGERILFKQKIQQHRFSSSLPTSHLSVYTQMEKVLPIIMRYLFIPKHPISPF
jgi:hypothetical protein